MSVTARGRLTARMLRTRPGASTLVAVLVLLLAALGATVPIALTAVADATIRAALNDPAPTTRDVIAVAAGSPLEVRPGAVSRGWQPWQERLEEIVEEVPAPLNDMLGEPITYYVPEAKLQYADLGMLSLAIVPDYQRHLSLVEGRWPELVIPSADDPSDAPRQYFPVEIVLAATTAERTGLNLGDEFQQDGVRATLVGLFEAAPGGDVFADHAPVVTRPSQQVSAYGEVFYNGVAVMPEEILDYFEGGQTRVWFPLDPDIASLAEADAILQQLRALTSRVYEITSSPTMGYVSSITLHTGSIEALEDGRSSVNAMYALITLTLSAPAGVAVVVLALACRIVAWSRRPSLALLATRGASPGTLRGILAIHGVVLGIPAALLGAAAIVILAQTADFAVPLATFVAPALVALVPAVVLGALTPPRAGLRDDLGAAMRPWLRALLEITVLAAAALTTGILILQTLSGVRIGASDQPGTAGLVSALVPLLWGLAGCVLALRIVPFLVSGMLSRARRRRDLTSLLGPARSLRERASGVAPALALLIGMSSAVGSGVLYGSIEHDMRLAADRTVGADVQIAHADLSEGTLAAIAEIEGVNEIAPITRVGPVTLRIESGSGGRNISTTALFTDMEALARIQNAQTRLVPLVPDDLSTAIVLSTQAAEGSDIGDEVQISRVPMEVQAITETRALSGVSGNWTLMDYAAHERVGVGLSSEPSYAMLALDAGASSSAVVAEIRELLGPTVTILTPEQIAENLIERPGTTAVRTALLGAGVGAAALSALAVVLALSLSAPGRARIVALLQMLGASPRTGRRLITWELMPPLLSALVIGAGVGLALPLLLLATVDLSAFTGSGREPAYHLDPLLLGGAIAAFLAVTLLFTATALWIARRARLVVLLRAGQEG